MMGATGPAGATGPQGPRGPGISWADATGNVIPGLFAQLGGPGDSVLRFMYVDSNGDLWAAGVGADEALFFDSALVPSGLPGLFNVGTVYTSPDCSGPPSFLGVPYAHVVFFEQHVDDSRILRVRNINAQLTNAIIQSIVNPSSSDGTPNA